MTSDRSALSTSPSLAPAVGPRALAALAGGVAATLALGLSELLAGILPGATSLVAAVGQVVIDLQPAGAKDLVVALFGTNDKLALELFVSLVAIAIGAALGVVAGRSFPTAAGGFAAFGVVGFLAALGDPLANPSLLAVQVALSVGVAIWVLSSLRTRLAALGPARSSTPSIPDPALRSFLLRTGAIGLAAVAAGFA